MSSSSFILAFIGGIGGGEITLVFLVVLMLFGGEKMPELARGIGKVIREIKKATSGAEEQIKQALAEAPPPQPRQFPTANVPTSNLPPVYQPPAVAITPVETPPAPAPIALGDTPPAPGTQKA